MSSARGTLSQLVDKVLPSMGQRTQWPARVPIPQGHGTVCPSSQGGKGRDAVCILMREMDSFPEDVFVVHSPCARSPALHTGGTAVSESGRNPRLHGAHILMAFPKDYTETGNIQLLLAIHSYYSATGGEENSSGQLNKL